MERAREGGSHAFCQAAASACAAAAEKQLSVVLFLAALLTSLARVVVLEARGQRVSPACTSGAPSAAVQKLPRSTLRHASLRQARAQTQSPLVGRPDASLC